MYLMLLPAAVGLQDGPVEGYRGRAATIMVLGVHLLPIHVRYTLVILDEGNLPHPWCPRCDILVPWVVLNGRHATNTKCARGAEKKWRRMASEEMRDSTARAF